MSGCKFATAEGPRTRENREGNVGTEDLIFQSVEETQEDNQIVNERLEDVPLRFFCCCSGHRASAAGVISLATDTGYTCFHDIAKFQDYILLCPASTVGYGDIVPTPRCVQVES